jgi:hypothetical protein
MKSTALGRTFACMTPMASYVAGHRGPCSTAAKKQGLDANMLRLRSTARDVRPPAISRHRRRVSPAT